MLVIMSCVTVVFCLANIKMSYVIVVFFLAYNTKIMAYVGYNCRSIDPISPTQSSIQVFKVVKSICRLAALWLKFLHNMV